MRFLISSLMALCVSAGVASASTITVETFSVGDYNSSLGGLGGTIFSENFESFDVGNVGGVGSPFETSIGSFETLGGTGSGGTVTNAAFDNDGTQLAIREGNVFGRTSTTAALTGVSSNDQFLDSNDTFGIRFVADLGGRLFDQILLTLSDAADTGATVTVSTGSGEDAVFQSQAGSLQQTLLIDFGGFVSSATINFTNTDGIGGALRNNDGFSLDDIAVSAVPLPAAGWMLLAGVGGLVAMRRRRKLQA